MPSHADESLWTREQAFLEGERARFPEQFSNAVTDRAALRRWIGITLESSRSLPLGYLRYSPLDFIVEEIRPDGTPVTLEGNAPSTENTPPRESPTIYADLVKVGISTLDATARIAHALQIEERNVRYAGIKDARALTAQRVSIRGATRARVEALSLPNLFLRNIHEGKGAVNIGDLGGNRFSLFIRTEGAPDEKLLTQAFDTLGTKGALNFYGIQRFGTPRIMAHHFGRFLLRGDFKGAVYAHLTAESPFEWKYVRELRGEAARAWGDWEAMSGMMEVLPYTFRFERALLKALAERPEPDWIGALAIIPEQVTLWARAYASYLTNLALSRLRDEGLAMPQSIPLLLALDPKNRAFYEPWLAADGTDDFLRNIGPCRRFLHIGDRPEIPAVVRPAIAGIAFTPEGVAVSFSLPKGAYATTVLSAVFDVLGSTPIPEWVKGATYDVKELTGTGSIAGAVERLAAFINEREATESARSEE